MKISLFDACDYEKILDYYGVFSIEHMTHINNLPSILKYGLLSHNNSLKKVDISNTIVNQRRGIREPIFHKPIHSYVPFYFNAKNPMLSYLRNIQNDIIILSFDRNLLFEYGVVFTNGNAASSKTKFFSDIKDLRKLYWECLQDKYWNNYYDGKRLRMAEVLVPDKVSIDRLERIICNNIYTYNKVAQIAKNYDVEIVLDKYKKFYF